MTKHLSQIACFSAAAICIAATACIDGEARLAVMQLAGEPPAAERSVVLTREDRVNRNLDSTSEAMGAGKSDTIGLAQRQEHRAACRSVRYERCDE